MAMAGPSTLAPLSPMAMVGQPVSPMAAAACTKRTPFINSLEIDPLL